MLVFVDNILEEEECFLMFCIWFWIGIVLKKFLK